MPLSSSVLLICFGFLLGGGPGPCSGLIAENNIDLFWNLYDSVIAGGRILHDVAEGVGAVSKAIRAIDMFLDSTAEMKKLATDDEGKDETSNTQIEGGEGEAQTGAAKNQEPIPVIAETDPELDAITPSFSGCGALGFHIRDETLPIAQLTSCCSAHGTCYSSACKANKRDCDSKLRTCLFAVCDDKTLDKSKQKMCRGAGKLLFSGTMALSFQQYNTAQAKLDCKSKPKEKGRRR